MPVNDSSFALQMAIRENTFFRQCLAGRKLKRKTENKNKRMTVGLLCNEMINEFFFCGNYIKCVQSIDASC